MALIQHIDKVCFQVEDVVEVADVSADRCPPRVVENKPLFPG
jgi:hypothetical protein